MFKKMVLTVLIIAAGSAIYFLFETPFAENTIDYFSFLVGLFLITEASYKIIKYPEKFFPGQFLRSIRIILGTCIFTIHLFQFMDKL